MLCTCANLERLKRWWTIPFLYDRYAWDLLLLGWEGVLLSLLDYLLVCALVFLLYPITSFYSESLVRISTKQRIQYGKCTNNLHSVLLMPLHITLIVHLMFVKLPLSSQTPSLQDGEEHSNARYQSLSHKCVFYASPLLPKRTLPLTTLHP